MLPDNVEKNPVREFLFFASFESYDYLSKANVCFIKTQCLTGYKKQTTQVIKFPDTGF